MLAKCVIGGGEKLAPAAAAIGDDRACVGVISFPDTFPIGDAEDMERELIADEQGSNQASFDLLE